MALGQNTQWLQVAQGPISALTQTTVTLLGEQFKND